MDRRRIFLPKITGGQCVDNNFATKPSNKLEDMDFSDFLFCFGTNELRNLNSIQKLFLFLYEIYRFFTN